MAGLALGDSSGDSGDKVRQLTRRLHALLLGGADMQDALETAQSLLEQAEISGHARLHWRVQRTLETGMFITYARPFTKSRRNGLPTLKLAQDLTKELVDSHNEIVRRRNTVYAHTDETGLRHILQTTGTAELAQWLSGQGELSEQWFSPKREMLADVVALARANLRTFLEEINEIVSKHS
jgi:hypothetical protein